MAWDILITNIKGLAQVRDSTPTVLAGLAMAQLPILDNAYLAIEGGKIVDYGEMLSLSNATANQVIDAKGRFVFPSFVDFHTHLVFAASREEVFVM